MSHARFNEIFEQTRVAGIGTDEANRLRVELALAKVAEEDPELRAALLENPRQTLLSLGLALHPNLRIVVGDESKDTMYVTLRNPRWAEGWVESEDLSDEMLEAVSGGASPPSVSGPSTPPPPPTDGPK